MHECSKSIPRRLQDSRFVRRFFVGNGIDIGGQPDPLKLYSEFFPLCDSIRTWDLRDGDAQYMKSVEDNQFDFVHSSHCLEHMRDPYVALKNWFRILKPGGYLIILVPDEDLYEQGVFPSRYNSDHKFTFTIYKPKSWSSDSINITEYLSSLGWEADIVKIELLDSSYRFNLPHYDQTCTPIGESSIELIVRKRVADEKSKKGNLCKGVQPLPGERVHYNQYRIDYQTMKKANIDHPPFSNEEEL